MRVVAAATTLGVVVQTLPRFLSSYIKEIIEKVHTCTPLSHSFSSSSGPSLPPLLLFLSSSLSTSLLPFPSLPPSLPFSFLPLFLKNFFLPSLPPLLLFLSSSLSTSLLPFPSLPPSLLFPLHLFLPPFFLPFIFSPSIYFLLFLIPSLSHSLPPLLPPSLAPSLPSFLPLSLPPLPSSLQLCLLGLVGDGKGKYGVDMVVEVSNVR